MFNKIKEFFFGKKQDKVEYEVPYKLEPAYDIKPLVKLGPEKDEPVKEEKKVTAKSRRTAKPAEKVTAVSVPQEKKANTRRKAQVGAPVAKSTTLPKKTNSRKPKAV
jgi:hypothetical protein